MTITLTDLFCGAGGSSTGAIAIPDITVRTASNHWDKAIETHSLNHPDAEHICADISQIDPRYFPHTDLLWASPSCTKHSVAQGKRRQDAQPDLFGETLPDAAAERSRATMWDVVRFAEYHQYLAVIVENVIDVYFWPPFQSWMLAMESIGYVGQIVYLNSMHAQLYGPGAPQSRDRIYVVFTRAGAPARTCRALCPPPQFARAAGPCGRSSRGRNSTAARGASTAPSTCTAAQTSRAATRSSNRYFAPPPKSSTGRCGALASVIAIARWPPKRWHG